jgi:prenyltransferase beta subunit
VRLLAGTLALSAALLAASATAAPTPANKARLDSTVRYLQAAQQSNGGFARAGEPSQISSAWTALALAAAGINPQDQRAGAGGVDAYSFLVGHFRQGVEEELCAPLVCTTAYERELMVVNTAGASPHDFGGVDLVQGLLSRVGADGSFALVPGGEGAVNTTTFAIFALAPIPEPAAQAPIQGAADWIEGAQQDNGGWAWNDRDSPDEVDLTGAAIQALIAAGRPGGAAVRKGIDYLRKAQNPDGGFPEFPGDPESNVASTAWAVQAIWAAGLNPEDWRTHSGQASEEPLDYLESLQAPDGHIAWKKSADTNGVWMTAYVAPAFAGQAWPIPYVPRARAATPEQPGAGGDQSGAGVIAGGGGGGAPLFSRPRPQSRGRTPGGARVIQNEDVRAANHSRTRRGANTRQPAGTQSAEATSPPADPAASSAAPAALLDSGVRSGSGSGALGLDRGHGSSSAGDGAGASSAGAGTGGGGSQIPAALAADGQSSSAGAGREVTGTVIGSFGSTRQGELAFGAPGLHGAGVAGEEPGELALVIGAAALLLALAGAGWERRRGEAIL